MFQLAWLLAPLAYKHQSHKHLGLAVVVCVLQAACYQTSPAVLIAVTMYAAASGDTSLLRLYPLLLLYVATPHKWFLHMPCIVIEIYRYLAIIDSTAHTEPHIPPPG